MVRRVFWVTSRALQIWIMGQNEIALRNAKTEFEYKRDKTIDVSTWDAKELAFVLFRMILETNDQIFLNDAIKLQGFHLDLSPINWLYSFEHREPRLAYHAIFLAYYASLYWLVIRSKKQGWLDLRKIGFGISVTVAKYLFVEDGSTLCGGVVFPTVPGLPATPFRICMPGTVHAQPPSGAQVISGDGLSLTA